MDPEWFVSLIVFGTFSIVCFVVWVCFRSEEKHEPSSLVIREIDDAEYSKRLEKDYQNLLESWYCFMKSRERLIK